MQILGRLNHPNIVTIHDTGSSAGAFYYVTDYISGERLDDHVNTHKLSLRDTLTLFAEICDAVSAAHLLGVIHRDLKPGNILIEETGRPRVLDFGLAKLVAEDAPQGTMTTTGEFVGSLPWASPEQVVGSPQDLDVRTDVYSLGVMLYQALTGQFPYPVRGSVPEIVENIRNVEPAHPSSVRREIGVDVDTIVLKCLSKGRERRYQTAGELGRDLRHYLTGAPIEARRDSVVYVLRKHLRRYWLPMAVAALFVAVVTVGFVSSLMFWRQAVQERNDAEAARSAEAEQRAAAEHSAVQAAREYAKAQAVLDFLNEDLLAAADPKNTADREITVREALDAAAANIAGRFDDQPLVEAAIRTTLGVTYQSCGAADSAEPHFARALELRRAALGDEHEDTLNAAIWLVDLYARQGRYDEALALAEHTLDTARRAFGDDSITTATCAGTLGKVYFDRGRYAEAEPLQVQAFKVARQIIGAEHETTLTYMGNLALLYGYQGRYADAEPLMVESYEIRQDAYGPEHPKTLLAASNLGALYRAQGRLDEAEPLFVQTLERRERLLGEEHPATLVSLNNLAALYSSQGRDAEAEPLHRRALEGRRRAQGADHPATLRATINLTKLYLRQRRYAEAASLCDGLLENTRRVFGPEHPSTIEALSAIGLLRRSQQRYDEAERLLVEALDLGRRAFGDKSVRTTTVMNNLGLVYESQGRHDQAEPMFVEALALRRDALGATHLNTLSSAHFLAHVYRMMGRSKEAEPLFRDAYEGRRTQLGDTQQHTLESLRGLIRSLIDQERFVEAEELALQHQDMAQAARDGSPEVVTAAQELLTELYTAWDGCDDADGWRDP